MQEGDIIKVFCYSFSVLNLVLKLKYNDEPMNPLYKYFCPKNKSHQLNLYYSRGCKVDPKYVELSEKHPENGCEHDFDKIDKFKTHYFCPVCNLSFCGECVFNSREKNQNAHKPHETVTPTANTVLYTDNDNKKRLRVTKSYVYDLPENKY